MPTEVSSRRPCQSTVIAPGRSASQVAGALPGQADAHPVAGQGRWHENQSPLEAGEAIAARAQSLDIEFHLSAAAAPCSPPHLTLPEVARSAAAE